MLTLGESITSVAPASRPIVIGISLESNETGESDSGARIKRIELHFGFSQSVSIGADEVDAALDDEWMGG